MRQEPRCRLVYGAELPNEALKLARRFAPRSSTPGRRDALVM
jgi:hypothetical protein